MGEFVNILSGFHMAWSRFGSFPGLIVTFLSFSSIVFGVQYSAIKYADLDHDGRIETIDVDSERPSALEIRRNRKLLWSGVSSGWKPWKLEIADVDGDGKPEIVLGVFKSTKFFPQPHNCLFIYGWALDHAYPKWLGSSLARPFTDFLFADLDEQPGTELFAVETSLDGRKSIGVYRWNGFGFTLERRTGDWHTAKILGSQDGQISVEADGEHLFVSAKTGASHEK